MNKSTAGSVSTATFSKDAGAAPQQEQPTKNSLEKVLAQMLEKQHPRDAYELLDSSVDAKHYPTLRDAMDKLDYLLPDPQQTMGEHKQDQVMTDGESLDPRLQKFQEAYKNGLLKIAMETSPHNRAQLEYIKRWALLIHLRDLTPPATEEVDDSSAATAAGDWIPMLLDSWADYASFPCSICKQSSLVAIRTFAEQIWFLCAKCQLNKVATAGHCLVCNTPVQTGLKFLIKGPDLHEAVPCSQTCLDILNIHSGA
jgi:hypothetical protein